MTAEHLNALNGACMAIGGTLCGIVFVGIMLMAILGGRK